MEATYPLYHKEPARSWEVFCIPKPLLVGGFGCDELVLYGIRELAYTMKLSTNESQASTFFDQWEWTVDQADLHAVTTQYAPVSCVVMQSSNGFQGPRSFTIIILSRKIWIIGKPKVQGIHRDGFGCIIEVKLLLLRLDVNVSFTFIVWYSKHNYIVIFKILKRNFERTELVK